MGMRLSVWPFVLALARVVSSHWALDEWFRRVSHSLSRLGKPRFLVGALIHLFISLYKIQGFKDLCCYKSLNHFFTREPVGKVCIGEECVVSPVEGFVVSYGRVRDGFLVQAKGVGYTLESLVVDRGLAKRFFGGSYVVIYLSPGDCHRIYFPVSGFVTMLIHIPGQHLPVSLGLLRSFPGVFTRNERLVTVVSSGEVGDVAIVKIGAMAVGGIRVVYDSFEPSKVLSRREYDPPIRVFRGDELGCFELGSTVVLLFQAGRVCVCGRGKVWRVKIGEPIALANRKK